MNKSDEDSDRRWIISIIEEGAKSDYWKILKDVVVEWIEEENRRLNLYKKTGIGEDEIYKYNRAVDRIEYLNKFLTINETVYNYNNSLLVKVKEKAKDFYNVGKSFVEELIK